MSGLVASPGYARDGTVIAWAPGQAAAISMDWGRTFTAMAEPKGLSWPWGVNAIDVAGHPRLIEWMWPDRNGALPYYSDDLGATWHAAAHSGALAHGFAVLDVSAVVTSTRLVAAGAPGPTTDRAYVCSTDAGVSWGDCPADN
jgi:hypothetical protein